jgi:uncharacterized cupin superfamily protein
MKPAIDPKSVPSHIGTGYPAPYDEGVKNREKRKIGDVFGLTQFGVNLTRLPPGEMSAQRHWHHKEDEFVMVLDGIATLVTNEGETEMTRGMVAGFPAGVPNGHHLVNKSDGDVWYLEIGSRIPDELADYPDIDMALVNKGGEITFVRKDGSPFEENGK